MNKQMIKQTILSPHEKIHGKLPPLKQADILFVHIKGDLMRYFLRKSTHCYWDHAGLILYPKDPKEGSLHNIIIEAEDPFGVRVHKLEKYINKPEKYEIGIKRIDELDKKMRKRILAFMLMNIDAPYYKLRWWRFFFAWIFRSYGKYLFGRQRYCCSGFVQKAFYEAADWDKRDNIIFREDFLSPMELQDITTPADIARSNKSKWVYNKKLCNKNTNIK